MLGWTFFKESVFGLELCLPSATDGIRGWREPGPVATRRQRAVALGYGARVHGSDPGGAGVPSSQGGDAQGPAGECVKMLVRVSVSVSVCPSICLSVSAVSVVLGKLPLQSNFRGT